MSHVFVSKWTVKEHTSYGDPVELNQSYNNYKTPGLRLKTQAALTANDFAGSFCARYLRQTDF